jgi:hypothetical protein
MQPFHYKDTMRDTLISNTTKTTPKNASSTENAIFPPHQKNTPGSKIYYSLPSLPITEAE